MAGIYTRDNREQILTAALDNAMRRKQEYTDRKNARAQENAKAISDFLKAAGRTYETWESDEEKLAALEKEREEAVAAEKYDQQVAQRQAVNDYLLNMGGGSAGTKYSQPAGPSQAEMFSEAMRGYEPNRMLGSRWYSGSSLGLLENGELSRALDKYDDETYPKLRVSMNRGLY